MEKGEKGTNSWSCSLYPIYTMDTNTNRYKHTHDINKNALVLLELSGHFGAKYFNVLNG